MAIAREATAAGNTQADTPWSLSWSHTSSGGTGCVVIIGITFNGGLATGTNRMNTTTSVTYDGSAALFIGTGNVGTNDSGVLSLFAVWNPPSGTKTISATMSTTASGSPTMSAGCSVSYTGVGGIRALSQVNYSTGRTSPSITVASATGRKLVHIGSNQGSYTASSYTQSLRYQVTTDSRSFVMGDADGASSVSMGYTSGGGSDGQLVAELIPDTDTSQTCIRSSAFGRNTGSSTSLGGGTITHVLDSSGSRTWAVVLVGISISTNHTDTTCSVTFGGTSMTQLGTLEQVGSSTTRAAIGVYALQNPPTGSNSVVVTTGGAGTKTAVATESIVYHNVATITRSAATTGATDNAITPTYSELVNRILSLHISDTSFLTSSTVPSGYDWYRNGSSVSGSGDYFAVQESMGTGSSVTMSLPTSSGQMLNTAILLTAVDWQFATGGMSFTKAVADLQGAQTITSTSFAPVMKPALADIHGEQRNTSTLVSQMLPIRTAMYAPNPSNGVLGAQLARVLFSGQQTIPNVTPSNWLGITEQSTQLRSIDSAHLIYTPASLVGGNVQPVNVSGPWRAVTISLSDTLLPSGALAEVWNRIPSVATVYTLGDLTWNYTNDMPGSLMGQFNQYPYTIQRIKYPASLDSTSVPKGVTLLDTALMASTGTVVILAQGQGCEVVSEWMRRNAGVSSRETLALRVTFLLVGNPLRAYGGAGVGEIETVNEGKVGQPTPTDLPWPVLDIARRYDGLCDVPDDLTNAIAVANAKMGKSAFKSYSTVELYDPAHTVWSQGNTTFVLTNEAPPIFAKMSRWPDDVKSWVQYRIEQAYTRIDEDPLSQPPVAPNPFWQAFVDRLTS